MTCQEIRQRMFAQLVGDPSATPGEPDSELRSHLRACATCAQAMEDWLRSARAVRALHVAPNPALAAHTRQRLRERGAQLRRRRHATWLVVTASLASLAMNLMALRITWAAAGFLHAWWALPPWTQWGIFAGLAVIPCGLVAVMVWAVGMASGANFTGIVSEEL